MLKYLSMKQEMILDFQTLRIGLCLRQLEKQNKKTQKGHF